MTNNLLKSSPVWFLRPNHLRNNLEQNFATSHPPSPETLSFFPSEEEYCIRKYCPVTLGYLLPDLHFTRMEAVKDATLDFDFDLRQKFEKHLDDTHPLLSASTSLSEDSSNSDNNSQLGDRIENDLSSGARKPLKRLELQLPKVNYPQKNMKFLLPAAELNNRKSSSVLTKSFCTGCINKNAVPQKSPSYRKFHKRNKNRMRENSISNLSLPSIANEFCFSFKEMVPEEEYLCGNYKNIPFDEYIKDECLVVPPTASSKRDASAHRPRTYDLKYPNKLHFVSPVAEDALRPVKELSFDYLPPSPYMVELARLRKEKLKIEEKLLLKKRQLQEIERLRSPTYKWYEMKDERFHEEARRNNVYLRNEKIIPFIRERRRLMLENIKA